MIGYYRVAQTLIRGSEEASKRPGPKVILCSPVYNGHSTYSPEGSLKARAGGQAVREVGYPGVRPSSYPLSNLTQGIERSTLQR